MSAKRQRKKVESIEEGKKAAEERRRAAALKSKADAIALLRERFHLPKLAAVIQRGSSDSTYELKLEDNSIIVLGSAYEIHQQAKVRARLFDAKAVMSKYSAEKWDEVLRAIRDAAEEVETFTEAEELRNYVQSYMRVNSTTKREHQGLARLSLNEFKNEEALLSFLRVKRHKGFFDDRRVYLSQSGFTAYINAFRSGRYSDRDVADMLSRHGFEYKQKTIAYTSESGERKTFNAGRFWCSPEGYLDEL